MGFYSSSSNRLGYSRPIRNSDINSGGIHSTEILRHDGYLLPRSVFFYSPLNDVAGTNCNKIAAYTSHSGHNLGSRTNRIWRHNGSENGAIIAVPKTHPLGYTTCFNGGGAGTNIDLDTTEGDEVWLQSIVQGTSGTYAGLTTNITLECFFYIGTNSNAGSDPWARLIHFGGWYNDEDGFDIEFNGTEDDEISIHVTYGQTTSRDSVGSGNIGTERWHYLRVCREITSVATGPDTTRATVHLGECTDDSDVTQTTVARVLDDTTTSQTNHNWKFLPDSSDTGAFLSIGQQHEKLSDDDYSFIGGMSDVVMRINDPMAHYKNNDSTLTIPTVSQLGTTLAPFGTA